mmetsp:Transcript_31159/g.73843  ORF Transcript_31159/g.73843 Transcript_31159/m.73843 type:complete len:246 (+) Transcript_31159:34-771(+)
MAGARQPKNRWWWMAWRDGARPQPARASRRRARASLRPRRKRAPTRSRGAWTRCAQSSLDRTTSRCCVCPPRCRTCSDVLPGRLPRTTSEGRIGSWRGSAIRTNAPISRRKMASLLKRLTSPSGRRRSCSARRTRRGRTSASGSRRRNSTATVARRGCRGGWRLGTSAGLPRGVEMKRRSGEPWSEICWALNTRRWETMCREGWRRSVSSPKSRSWSGRRRRHWRQTTRLTPTPTRRRGCEARAR